MRTAEDIGIKILATLGAQAERKRQAGIALREAIEAVISAHTGPKRLTAKQVSKLLVRSPVPSLRSIQEHMKLIRASSSVPRL
jgi:hypothetical protein